MKDIVLEVRKGEDQEVEKQDQVEVTEIVHKITEGIEAGVEKIIEEDLEVDRDLIVETEGIIK